MEPEESSVSSRSSSARGVAREVVVGILIAAVGAVIAGMILFFVSMNGNRDDEGGDASVGDVTASPSGDDETATVLDASTSTTEALAAPDPGRDELQQALLTGPEVGAVVGLGPDTKWGVNTNHYGNSMYEPDLVPVDGTAEGLCGHQAPRALITEFRDVSNGLGTIIGSGSALSTFATAGDASDALADLERAARSCVDGLLAFADVGFQFNNADPSGSDRAQVVFVSGNVLGQVSLVAKPPLAAAGAEDLAQLLLSRVPL